MTTENRKTDEKSTAQGVDVQAMVMQLFKKIEELSESVHNARMHEKHNQGFHSPLSCPIAGGGKFEKHCDKCHLDLYSYSELPENIKEYDRVTIKAVLNAIGRIKKK